MKRRLDEGTVLKIHQTLLERFGEPIGKTVSDRQGVADERGGHPHKGKPMGNRGFGAKFNEAASTCSQCGGMMGMDEDTCSQCGMMGAMDESENSNRRGARHPGHASSCSCPDCSRSYEQTHPPVDAPEPVTELDEEPMGPQCRCGSERVEKTSGDMLKCKECGRIWMPLDEEAPPGREKQVKALKKNKDIDNAYAVAWASYNKKH